MTTLRWLRSGDRQGKMSDDVMRLITTVLVVQAVRDRHIGLPALDTGKVATAYMARLLVC